MAKQMQKPNFLRVEVMTYRNNAPSEETCWKLFDITVSESEARRILAEENYLLRVVECTNRGRIVVDKNF